MKYAARVVYIEKKSDLPKEKHYVIETADELARWQQEKEAKRQALRKARNKDFKSGGLIKCEVRPVLTLVEK